MSRSKYCVVVNHDHLEESSDVIAAIYPDFESAVEGTIEWAKQRMSYRRGPKYGEKWWLPKDAWRKARRTLRENNYLRINAVYCKEDRENAFDTEHVDMYVSDHMVWELQPDTGVSR